MPASAGGPQDRFARVRYGGRVQWHGLGVFHFDAAGRITGKLTYATFRLPLREQAGQSR